MKQLRVSAIFLLLACASLGLAQATQVEHRSPQQLGAQSTLVVLGRVAEVRSFWNEKHTKIFTDTRIDIEQTFKGAQVPSVTLRQLGGTVGTVRVSVAGALQWSAGEEVLLFLEPYAEGTYHVSGFSQGRYDVARDPQTGRAYVSRPVLEGIELVDAPDGDATQSSRVENVTLEQFISQALGGR